MINIFEKVFPKNLYHSYVIEGEPEITATNLLKFLEVRGDVKSHSSDVLFQVYESFNIDNGREIKDWHSKLGITGGKRICIIATKFINREAEQSLLKIIEEPAEGTHFFMVVPNVSLLLDTILSRTHVIKVNSSFNDNDEMIKDVMTFIKSSPKERMNKITLIIKENEEVDSSGKLRAYATSFINVIESIFYQKFKQNINDKKNKFILKELQKSQIGRAHV